MRFVIALLLAGLASGIAAQEEADVRYVAKNPSVALLETPSPDAVILARLTPEEAVTVLGESGGFVNVRTVSGMNGWLAAEDIEQSMPASVQLQQAEARIGELEDEVASLQRRLRNAQAQARQASAALSSTQEDVEGEIGELRQQLEATQSALDVSRQENASLEAELAEFEMAEQSRRVLAETQPADSGMERDFGVRPGLLALTGMLLMLLGIAGGYALKTRRVRKRLHGLDI